MELCTIIATRSPVLTPRDFSTLATRLARMFSSTKVSELSPQIKAILSERATDCMVKISRARDGASLKPPFGAGMAHPPILLLCHELWNKQKNYIMLL